MGLLDIFKKKEQAKPTTQYTPQQRESTISIQEIIGQNGKRYIEVNYYDANANFKNFYDTTRLIIDTTANEDNIYSAKASWYGEEDAIMFDSTGKDISSRNDMVDIKLGIDLGKLTTDGNYQTVLMTKLLEQKRVKRYLERGLQEEVTNPCGNYIGKVALVQDKKTKIWHYSKLFEPMVGRKVHYSQEQVNRRENYRKNREMQRQAMIADKQKQMQELQAEIDELNQ